MNIEKDREYIVKYFCNCVAKEISSKDIPEWPWIDSGNKVCLNCGLVIMNEIILPDGVIREPVSHGL